MKKSFKILGLLAFALMSITACTEDNTVEPSAAIIGFWGINSTYTAFYIDGQLVQADTAALATDELTLNFTANGLAIGIEKDSSGNFTNDTAYYTLTGSNLVVVDKSTVPFDTTVFTTTITGNKLKMFGSQVDTSMFGITKVDFEYNGTKLVR
ncbi:MAG: hypothetical protein RIR80_100 [Bacteroidota bacterium]